MSLNMHIKTGQISQISMGTFVIHICDLTLAVMCTLKNTHTDTDLNFNLPSNENYVKYTGRKQFKK